ncbi:MAG: YbhN family protein [Candidatus Hodarchaeota archaeon]
MTEVESNRLILFLKRRKRIIIGFTTILLVVFMIFVVDFIKVIQKVKLIGFLGMFLFIITYSIAFLFRSLKLKLIFRGIDKNIKFSTSYFSIGASFVLNDFTPGKLGDVAKIFIIKDQEKLLLSESIAGIAIERILDLILLFTISCSSLIYLYISSFGATENVEILGQDIQFYLILGALLLAGFVILLVLVLYKTETILKMINKLSVKIGNYLKRFLFNFKRGMKNFRNHKREFIYVIFLGFPTWIFDALIISIFFYILEHHVNIFLLLLAMILLFFSKTFPITPGGWGISENIGALFIFIFYPGIPYTEILSIFIIEHIFRSAYLVFYGGFSIIHYNIKIRQAALIME